ncbi:MAG TPA: nuclear transport factor 2 family protein [Streptosporangiaceae bacterium]|nr:nuclear transport factor 2 family protein [Streptosporangiaceae bacterium]
MTPAQVVQQRRQVLMDHDADGFAGLFAPDAVIEMPTAGPGTPKRLEGRAIIEEYSRRAVTGMHIDDFEDVAVHETADPEVVIAETVTRATLTATGESFTTPSIQVFRIRDGRIVLFRTYVAPPAELTRPSVSEQR